MSGARVTRFDEFFGDANAIEVRLAPIDVGFDLRANGMVASIPSDTKIASYEYEGVRYVVEGTSDEVIEALESAGYDAREVHKLEPGELAIAGKNAL